MSVGITGTAFLKYANRTMEAIALVPENRRQVKLWQMQVTDTDGMAEDIAMMTPPELAADIVNSFKYISDFITKDFEFSQESVQEMQESNKLLASKPMIEIARVGRERAITVSQMFDTITDTELDEVIPHPTQTRTVRQYLIFLFAHMIHHRGQLYTMLRSFGVKPPAFMG